MKLSELNIGGLRARLPIIQGGMGIGISLSRLASAVANEGGVGIISGVQIGYRDPHFRENPVKANLKAIGEEIAKARKLSPHGVIGMNFMSIDNHYSEYVREAVKNGIDLIISGAGLPARAAQTGGGHQNPYPAHCIVGARLPPDPDQLAQKGRPHAGWRGGRRPDGGRPSGL